MKRKDIIKYMRQQNAQYGAEFVIVEGQMPAGCIEVRRNNRFLIQIFEPGNGAQRITINRTMIDVDTGAWLDGITWDEIQKIKRDLGFGARDAVEVYPADSDVVNVANMRHIWLVDPLLFAWRPSK